MPRSHATRHSASNLRIRIGAQLESPCAPTMNNLRTAEHDVDRVSFAEVWAAVAELQQCGAAVPDCDATGKLRGKLWRLETTLKEAEATGDLAAFRAEAQSAEALLRRIVDADPLSRMLRCVQQLNERIK
jgi:hypothetical protein